ncbi:MAG: aminoglycoside phosphotransferase family protein, partial [Nocardioidaceae bacterium]
MTDVDVPRGLRDNVSEVWGTAGRRWLDDLPRLLDEVADAWSLTVGDPYRLSLNWVAPAVRSDGTPAVLKLGVPESDHLGNEAAALTRFDGHVAVRLLDRDARRGALLLELAEPGTM